MSATQQALFMLAAAQGQIVLQLDGAGTNGSTTILDTSPSAHTMTALGDAQISTAQFSYGSSSLAFDGNDDRITTPDSSDWNFAAGDFCIEALVRPRSNTGDFQSMCARASSSAAADQAFYFRYSNTGWSAAAYVSSTGHTLTAGSGMPTVNTWHHAAFCREGGTLRLYANGVQGTTDPIGGATVNNPSAGLVIGVRGFDTAHDLHAYMHLRITKGWARYLGGTTFTPPTSF